MGAAEQETVEQFSNGHYRGLAARIEWVAGFDIPFEIKWDSVARGIDTDSFYELFSTVYFDPLIKAFQEIGRDKLGLFEGKIKRIVIQNSGKKSARLESGILTIDDGPSAGDGGLSLISEIKKALGH